MRYELRVTAFDMLDRVHVALVLQEYGDLDTGVIERSWATTATSRSKGLSGATEWTHEALRTALLAVPYEERPGDATPGPPGGSS